MGDRISRGWELVKESWSVLRGDKELMLFPILSSIACILAAASFALPFLLIPEWGKAFMDELNQTNHFSSGRILGYAIGFVFYFVNYFVIVFFNVALVSCALVRFRGGKPTVAGGLGAAWRRLPQILAWALVAATVGMLLQALEKQFSALGKIAVGLVGMVWSIAIYFVVPVLAAEGVGPLEAVRRSAKILMKTWGESLVGNLSMSTIGVLLSLPAFGLIFAGGVIALALHSLVLGIIVGSCGVICLVFLSIVLSTLQQIFLIRL